MSLYLSLSILQIIIQNERLFFLLFNHFQGKVNNLALSTTAKNRQLSHFVLTITLQSKHKTIKSFEITLWRGDWPYKELLQVWHQRINKAPLLSQQTSPLKMKKWLWPCTVWYRIQGRKCTLKRELPPPS